MGTTDTKIFDKETLLDLTVNFVPLGILLFFVLYMVILDPWSTYDDPLYLTLMLGLHIIPFVSLAILTYFSGKAIAGSEKEGEVYLAGRASVSSASPLEAEHHGEADETSGEIGEPDEAAQAAAAGDADAADEAAGEDEDVHEAGTPDRTSAEGQSGTEEEIETGSADEPEAGTKDANDSVAEDVDTDTDADADDDR